MNCLPTGIVNSRESIAQDISNFNKFDIDTLIKLWKVYKTSKAVLEAGKRLENLFWRIWSSGRLCTKLSGSRVALIMVMIHQGEEAFGRENPLLRIPEYRTNNPILPRPSIDIPPTPPPSPIESAMLAAHASHHLPSNLPSQSDITASLHQAFPPQRSSPSDPASARSPPGPPRPPPPSPATPCASPLLAAIASPQASEEMHRGPRISESVGDKNSSALVGNYNRSPRNNSHRPPPTRASSATLCVVEETAAYVPSRPALTSKNSTSTVSIVESAASSMASSWASSTAGATKGGKGGKIVGATRAGGTGRRKKVVSKKSLRPALMKKTSSSSSTAVNTDTSSTQRIPEGLVEHITEEPLTLDGIADKEYEEDFEDVDDKSEKSGTERKGGRKRSVAKGKITPQERSLAPKVRPQESAGRSDLTVEVGAVKRQDPKDNSDAIEGDADGDSTGTGAKLKEVRFQEEVKSTIGTGRKRKEKLVFLTSETEATAVKSHATTSISSPTSGLAVARKIKGKSVLVVGGVGSLNGPVLGDGVAMGHMTTGVVVQGFSNETTNRTTGFLPQVVEEGEGMGDFAKISPGSVGVKVGSVGKKSTLSLLFDDARVKSKKGK